MNKNFFRISLLLGCLLTVLACSEKPKKIIGIKIYQYNGEVNELVEQWQDIGINTAFISEGLAANKNFREVLRENSIPVYIIFPVFFNPLALAADTTLFAVTDRGEMAKDEWVEFVCPSRKNYRSQQIASVKQLVNDLHPDGISLDFIRQFIFWEKVYENRQPETIPGACYCQHCISDFAKKFSVTMPDTFASIPEKARYLLRYHGNSWNGYRTDLITSMVREISEAARKIRADIKITLHAVPWREEDFNGANIRVAAQDLKGLSSFADYISPMCYSAMLRRQPPWISSVVRNQDKQAPKMILPSIQVYDDENSINFDREMFATCIREALEPPSLGVVFWSWPLFEKDTVRMDVAKAAVDNILK